MLRRILLCGAVVASLVVVPGIALAVTTPSRDDAPPASTDSAAEGTYEVLTPRRLFDTRATGGPIAAGATRTVQVTGVGGVPSTGVQAVVLNLTATGGTKGGYLSVAAGGTTPGSTSSLNFGARETRANLVTVPVASNGTVVVRNGGGSGTAPVHAILDVQGYYLSSSAPTTDSQFFREQPTRFYDTRSNGSKKPLAASSILTITFPITLGAGEAVSALAVNVTAVGPKKAGYLVAYDGQGNPPSTSNVNFAAGRTTPNNVVLPVRTTTVNGVTTGQVAIANGSSGTTHVLIDVVGSYGTGDGGLVFRPLAAPVRIIDSRSSIGTDRLGPDDTAIISPPETVRDPVRTIYLVGNLTAVKPSAATFFTVWPAYDPNEQRPSISALNPASGQTVANHAFVELNSSNQFHLYNASGQTDVLFDVAGRFDYDPPNGTFRSGPRPARSILGDDAVGSVRPYRR